MQTNSEQIHAICVGVNLLVTAGVRFNNDFKCAVIDRGMDLARCAKDTVGLMEGLAAMTMLAKLLDA